MVEEILHYQSINIRLIELEKKMDKILNILDNIERGTTKMENHISFVETIYDKIKTPLGYAPSMINNIINNMIGYNNTNLAMLES